MGDDNFSIVAVEAGLVLIRIGLELASGDEACSEINGVYGELKK